jgi:predicted site-specific integrase-resolvase
LTNAAPCGIIIVEKYSISKAARVLKVDRRTLQRWIRDKRIPEPSTQTIADVKVKFWTEQDFQKLKEHKAREYWHKRKKQKKSGQ